MGSKNPVWGLRIDPQLKDNFVEFVREKHGGKKRGVLSSEVEKALQQYMADGEFSHMERQVDQIHSVVVRGEGGGADSLNDSDRERDSVSKTTEKRLEGITADLPSEGTVTESRLNRAIEDNAGSSYKTLQRYKEMLESRGYILPSPIDGEDQYFMDRKRFVLACEANLPVHRIDSVVDQYEDAFGEHWWIDALPDSMVDQTKYWELDSPEVQELHDDLLGSDDTTPGFQ